MTTNQIYGGHYTIQLDKYSTGDEYTVYLNGIAVTDQTSPVEPFDSVEEAKEWIDMDIKRRAEIAKSV